ncbi:hypothetical protein KQX54_017285 [Cotesia glomerata]|uniref:Uncharacterized protein n=1 Tax=Cotesia glomerata TaxID=32391 RepID=A0AAV7J158_COTGL|nr:hypothetical protein KQX54_017285 [Cotesia glomerata]
MSGPHSSTLAPVFSLPPPLGPRVFPSPPVVQGNSLGLMEGGREFPGVLRWVLRDFVILSKVMPLNKSQTKKLCCGLSYSENSFKPVVKISNPASRNEINLNIREWKKLCNSLPMINDYFIEEISKNFYRKYSQIHFEDLIIQFCEFKTERCIALHHQDTRIFLLTSTVSLLKSSTAAVNHWLDYIQNLPIDNYKKSITTSIASYLKNNTLKNSREMPKLDTLVKCIEYEIEDIFKSCERSSTIGSHIADQRYSMFWELLYFHDGLIQDIHKEIEKYFTPFTSMNYYQDIYCVNNDDHDVTY